MITDPFDIVQAEIADRLMQRLSLLRIAPNTILEVYAQHSALQARLQAQFPEATIVSDNMNALPLELTPELIVSNLSLQAFTLEAGLQQWYQQIQAGGEILFSTLGPQTEYETIYPNVKHFLYELISIGNALQGAGFKDPVVDREIITITYEDKPSATFEVIYGYAHKSAQARSFADAQGVVHIPADRLPVLK